MSMRKQRLKNKYLDLNVSFLFSLLFWHPAFVLDFNQKSFHRKPGDRFSITLKLLTRELKGGYGLGPSGYFLLQPS